MSYGQPHRRGRSRQYPTFADYLRDRIAYAESAANEQRLRALLIRSARQHDHKRSRAIETGQINRLMRVTGRDYADRLRELLADLNEA